MFVFQLKITIILPTINILLKNIMILKKPTSRLSIVNLFADFILSKIPQENESIIQVIDCKNFFVLKGKTSSKDVLDMSKISDEFTLKFSKYMDGVKLSHTIDLIEYDCSLKKSTELKHTYHYSQNCAYHSKQIESFKLNEASYNYDYFVKEVLDDELVLVSEFPHGYSLDQGRLLYYYGKHIIYGIPYNFIYSSLTLLLSTEKHEDGDQIFSIYNNTTNEEESQLSSIVLDVYDFDMSWLRSEIKKVDWSFEITNPLEDYEFIKKKNKDFILI